MLVVISVVLSVLTQVHAQSVDNVKHLSEYLFGEGRYNIGMRPVTNQSRAVQVNVAHAFKAIADINTEEGYITTTSDFEISWRDEFLTWNSTEFGGIDVIQLLSDTFWTPAVTVVDVIDGLNLAALVEETRYTPAWVDCDGTVSVYPQVTIHSTCDTDVRLFPFDKHTCYIELRSSMYSTRDVELSSNQGVLSDDIHTRLWDVTESHVESKTVLKGVRRFETLYFVFTVNKTKPMSIWLGMIPFSGIFLLSMITPFIPFDSGERLSFCVSLYLAFIIASDSKLQEVPSNSEQISLASASILSYSILNTLTVAWTVFIICISRRQTAVPGWMCRLLQKKPSVRQPKKDIATISDEKTTCNESSHDITDSVDESKTELEELTWSAVTKRLDMLFFYFFIGLYLCFVIASIVFLYVNDVISN